MLTHDGATLAPGLDVMIDGVAWSYGSLLNMSAAERSLLGVAWVETAPAPGDLCAQVDVERDRRIDGGFSFMGHIFQSRPSDRENIMGAAQLAMAAIGAGAQPGDLRWADPNEDFVWIVEDNSVVALDAFQTVAMFQAGIAFKKALTFHARDLKDALLAAADPATVDIESGWPA